jgi:quercetin dioxygenase-like cupin family protein
MTSPAISSTPALIDIVRRDDLQALGIHKDLGHHPALAAIIPEQAGLSVAWVHLDAGECLATRQHSAATMIVVCQGRGKLVGDRTEDLDAGDSVTIPPGCRHGFIGADEGLWALSIQFEANGLYEDPPAAPVRLAGDGAAGVAELLRRNAELARAHEDNAMFDLITGGHLADANRRARFLDAVQVWSNTFHRLLLLRGATTMDPKFSPLFEQHLGEEYDHATQLAADRAGALVELWDPILDAAANWFVGRMLVLDSAEKAVLIHLVLEVGSRVFHEVANPLLSPYGETDFFAVHEEADAEHEAMILAPLEGLDSAVYERLFAVQQQGWDMLNALCTRIAELALA